MLWPFALLSVLRLILTCASNTLYAADCSKLFLHSGTLKNPLTCYSTGYFSALSIHTSFTRSRIFMATLRNYLQHILSCPLLFFWHTQMLCPSRGFSHQMMKQRARERWLAQCRWKTAALPSYPSQSTASNHIQVPYSWLHCTGWQAVTDTAIQQK